MTQLKNIIFRRRGKKGIFYCNMILKCIALYAAVKTYMHSCTCMHTHRSWQMQSTMTTRVFWLVTRLTFTKKKKMFCKLDTNMTFKFFFYEFSKRERIFRPFRTFFGHELSQSLTCLILKMTIYNNKWQIF